MSKLTDIEGIGESYLAKLKEAGITSIENFLETCCNKKGRTAISEATGISDKVILTWANQADLSRIKGVSTQYAELLKRAGVDTVPELAQRNAENLAVKMTEVNEEKSLVRKLPTASQVTGWVDQAKDLPRVITH